MWFQTDRIQLSSDISSASWVSEGLRPWSWDAEENYPSVASFVPDVFESYARILHPVRNRDSDGNELPFLSWESVAAKNGKKMHPLVQYECIDGVERAPGAKNPWADNPREGSLDAEHLPALMKVLAEFTSVDEQCWFGLWEGWGGLSPGSATYLGRNTENRMSEGAEAREALQAQYAAAPRVKTRGRAYLLFSGALNGADAFVETRDDQSMSIWWSDSRSWCVATEIDFRSTYVGGSKECIAAILSDPTLEALPVNPDDRVDLHSDKINC